ncbi:MAG: electron transfer flavoprotein alpha subunit [Myxococcota bacterium]|jgi:electron transfer flavoprotein alpha subunit
MSSNEVVVCSWGEERGGLPAGAEEILTLASGLAGQLGGSLVWLTLGPAAAGIADIAAQYGVAAIRTIDDPKLADVPADATVAALAQYCEQTSPKVVIFNQSAATRTIAPRLAGKLAGGVVMNATKVAAAGEILEVTAAAYGGDTRVVYELPGAGTQVVSVAANNITAVSPNVGSSPATESVSVDLSGVDERIKVLVPAKSDGPRLEDAEIIVAGGRGLGDVANYKLIRELAEAMGGMPGASRPLVDEGWVDSNHQVGLTGKITKPTLYVAVGISGASQHMAGCGASNAIVAINKDSEAAIFQHAKFGIVGDALELLPELIRAAKS